MDCRSGKRDEREQDYGKELMNDTSIWSRHGARFCDKEDHNSIVPFNRGNISDVANIN